MIRRKSNFIIAVVLAASFFVTPHASASWFCFQPDPKPPLTIFKNVRAWVGPYFAKYPCTDAELEAAKAEQSATATGFIATLKGWFSKLKTIGTFLGGMLEKVSK